jgi:cardiolipin synthase
MKVKNALHPKYRFPWRKGNSFRILVDGSAFYAAMLERMAAARHYILLEMYLFESGEVADRFVNVLCEAAARGIQVYVLLDDYGSSGLSKDDRNRLKSGGVQLAFYNPLKFGDGHRNLFRDHRKLLVVDGEFAYTGGAGITDAFDPGLRPGMYWHETMVEVQGPNVQDWGTLFEENWNKWASAPPQLPPRPRLETERQQLGHVIASRSPTHSEINRSFIKHIRKATERVWLATAYFVPSRRVRRALRRRAKQGVDVRLMLPGAHNDHPWTRHMGRRYYARLLRNGVRIFEYQPRFLHSKVMLCDHWVSIGSSNVDRWNFRWSLEANQEIADREFAEQVQAQFEADFLECKEFHYDQWSRRPWHKRAREWYWGQVAALLSWFSYKKINPTKHDKNF